MVRSLVLALVTACVAGVCAGACVSEPNLTTANVADASDDGDASEPGEGDGAVDGEVPESGTTGGEDASSAACAAVCPAAGGTCAGETCVFVCPGAAGCLTGVACPPGVPCQVTCTGKQVCGAVDCGTASSCKVECTGEQACLRVRSRAAQTVIVCDGKDACKDSECLGQTCSIQCWNEACKADDVNCCAAQCSVNGATGRCN